MRYLLALLSHDGAPSPTAGRAVDSFADMVLPRPVAGASYHDGPGMPYAPVEVVYPGTWTGQAGGDQRGFCAATGALWRLAVEEATEAGCDYVFWLEHDFVLARYVDLRPLADILDRDESLAQMALMRTPVSPEEKTAGGLYELRRNEYTPVHEAVLGSAAPAAPTWLRHTAYFTTNPSLMRTAWMRTHPWPPFKSECEGRFGIELVAAGHSYGVWGDGDPWVEHVGERTGFGY